MPEKNIAHNIICLVKTFILAISNWLEPVNSCGCSDFWGDNKLTLEINLQLVTFICFHSLSWSIWTLMVARTDCRQVSQRQICNWKLDKYICCATLYIFHTDSVIFQTMGQEVGNYLWHAAHWDIWIIPCCGCIFIRQFFFCCLNLSNTSLSSII